MTDLEVVADALSRLESLGLRPLIGGSFASSAWGRARPTHDIDVSLAVRHEHLERLIQAFEPDYMVNRTEMEAAIENPEWPATFQLLHYKSTFKIDAFVNEGSIYDLSVAERASAAEILPGVRCWYVSAEDVVLMKLRWFELGRRVSDRQWNDVIMVIEVQGEAFDSSYLLHWAEHFAVRDLAESALAQARP